MFGSALLASAEGSARRERLELLRHYTTRLINAEVKLGRNPPQTDEGVRRLVENAARYVDAIFKEASE
jgi:hypothetical protein